jgi:hypothetical protein
VEWWVEGRRRRKQPGIFLTKTLESFELTKDQETKFRIGELSSLYWLGPRYEQDFELAENCVTDR